MNEPQKNGKRERSLNSQGPNVTTLKFPLAVTLLMVIAVATPAHAETATYSYDALGRLTQVVWSTGRTVTYTYDANGNRTAKVVS